MMVPVEVSVEAEKKGCWVKLYDKKNYEGDSLMLTGPISLGQMVGPFGFDWENYRAENQRYHFRQPEFSGSE